MRLNILTENFIKYMHHVQIYERKTVIQDEWLLWVLDSFDVVALFMPWLYILGVALIYGKINWQ